MSSILLILSVFLGALIVLFIKPKNQFISLLLAFSGSYLLSVTVLHLLPEVYTENNSPKTVGVLILVGILIQSILESFSKGAEHGHVHLHSDQNHFPWLLFISLSIHAFTEGLPIHDHNGHQHNLLWAIFIHKIPIAIILTTFLIKAKYSRKMIAFFLIFFSLMSPLGILVSENFVFIQRFHAEITAFTIGIFLHISTIILFESSENHKFNIQKFAAILFGILLTILTL
ncbi:Zinc transporter ZupT [Tenacibaculum sp. MAR_2009_124]|uniref:ZIP family metal transporter n=1 Tax=Tenacibaculum sp. MAR_2009_124 TaxID=1250059 RepID=UPI00089BC428|nr:ZIP family metal transporter [Tenacibaculum sp. MAR_2009_124]SEC93584.1 Zinc transporter ZupT [Tenacibaculum sp. MAR_2009_124]